MRNYLIIVEGAHDIAAVSYTHLDVYKRQEATLLSVATKFTVVPSNVTAVSYTHLDV